MTTFRGSVACIVKTKTKKILFDIMVLALLFFELL